MPAVETTTWRRAVVAAMARNDRRRSKKSSATRSRLFGWKVPAKPAIQDRQCIVEVTAALLASMRR